MPDIRSESKSRGGADQAMLWGTLLAGLFTFAPPALSLLAGSVTHALNCPIRIGETLPCTFGSTDLRGALDAIATPMDLLARNWSVMLAVQFGWLALAAVWLAAKVKQAHRPLSTRFILVGLALGLAPLVANILSTEIAGWFGCFVNEHGAYTRGKTLLDYDEMGCRAGGWEIGASLHSMHMSIFAVLFTWPLALVAILAGLAALVGRSKSSPH